MTEENGAPVPAVARTRQQFAANGPVALERLLRLRAIRDDALFIALADHPQHPLFAIDIVDIETGELTHAQARSIQQLENRAIALQQQRRILRGLRGLCRWAFCLGPLDL